MNGRDLAAIALRVWALLILIDTVATVPGTVLGLRATPWPAEQAQMIRATQYAALLQLILMIVLAASMLRWADGLARIAMPASQVQIGADAGQLLEVGLVLVGVGFVVHGLADAAALAYVLPDKPERGDTGVFEYLWITRGEGLVRAGVYLLAGLVLVLGRSALVTAWTQLKGVARRAG